MLTSEERQRKEQEICNLRCDLSSAVSDIGDWKMLKAAEYEKLGKKVPYDMEEYYAKREEARAKINALQAELDEDIKEMEE